jgi:hypothetical protein
MENEHCIEKKERCENISQERNLQEVCGMQSELLPDYTALLLGGQYSSQPPL